MYKVLIADDETIIRKGLRQLIDWEDLGYEVIGEAANGREALNFIKAKNPDVCMIDIRMPNLHGLDAIKEARDAGYNGKFIILSGFSEFSYAQDAIKYGVSNYLTKPVDEDELIAALKDIHKEISSQNIANNNNAIYIEKARETMMKEFLSESVPVTDTMISALGFKDTKYEVILFEKYNFNTSDISYNFNDLLQSTISNNEFEFISVDNNNAVLLIGDSAIEKFNKLLSKYNNELPPEKNSPLDTVFITCGRVVDNYSMIPESYKDASDLLSKRFFCDQYQHIMTYDEFAYDKGDNEAGKSASEIMDTYTTVLVNHIQAYNRNKIAEALHDLQNDLYNANLNTREEKNLLVDLYLHIKEKIFFLYKASNIPFMANSEAINIIHQCFYLYEIIAFLSKQFEMIMNSIGYSSRDSIIDDIVHYINHNYSENITLENIAPLFGYNSSYLGKIFSKKMEVNFNTYLDSIRIEHSKELLLKNKIQVYKVAELVGYRNVDYFHIKFKKSTGLSPAEFRRKNQAEN